MYRVIEDGFRSYNEYQSIDMPGCIPLVNSLGSAD
jgi:hypothetical protein